MCRTNAAGDSVLSHVVAVGGVAEDGQYMDSIEIMYLGTAPAGKEVRTWYYHGGVLKVARSEHVAFADETAAAIVVMGGRMRGDAVVPSTDAEIVYTTGEVTVKSGDGLPRALAEAAVAVL
jgi:hypothetical protein